MNCSTATSSAPVATDGSKHGLHYEDLYTLLRQLRHGLPKKERLTPDQVRVLRSVSFGPHSQSELMKETGFGKHKMSMIVGQLYKANLVDKQFDKEDARKHIIKATRHGTNFLHRLDENINKQLHQTSATDVQIGGSPAAAVPKELGSE